MTSRSHRYLFAIDVLQPSRMPMARLVDYMANLAALLGEHEHIHFDRVEPGSVVLAQYVDDVADAPVRERIRLASDAQAPEDIARSVGSLNKLLEEDEATGSLRGPDGVELLSFPGHRHSQSPTFGPFRQDGSCDGVLIRVGGKDETVPVHLLDGDTIRTCNTTREIARELARHLFGKPLRVYGNGRWLRNDGGDWEMLRFDIRGFDVLDDAPLAEVVRDLRATPQSGWRTIPDPIAELLRLRGHKPDPT